MSNSAKSGRGENSEHGLPPGMRAAAADLFRLLNETPLAGERSDEIDPDRTTDDGLAILVDTLNRRG